MDRMSPVDASFLHIEDGINHMHIGSIGVFEGPPPPYEELVAMVAGKLPLVPRYRQRVRFVPMELARPVWVDDATFNLRYHVRHTALPRPGGDDELRTLVGRVMSQELDRNRPLWEMWMVEGLEDDRWAVFTKFHHCMVDGVSGTDVISVIMDNSPQPSQPLPDDWSPEPEPHEARLVVDAVRDLVTSPYEQFRVLRARARDAGQLRSLLQDLRQGFPTLAKVATPPTGLDLNGPIGPHRRWNWARTQLGDVKKVRAAHGGTVNDVVLTVIAGGFRELVLSRGGDVEGRVVRTLVPVSVRAPDQKGVPNNQVSAMFADLPIGLTDPLERLTSIRAQMDGLKESKQAVAAEVLTSMAGFAPPMLLAMGTRLAARSTQNNVNTVTTNVPGPQTPMYACGRRMVEAFPYVPLANGVRIGLAIFSYDGQLNYGVTGDYDTAPDISVVCRGIEDGMAQLLARS
jgi:WS/DGAT/MGAT family acyltransferase